MLGVEEHKKADNTELKDKIKNYADEVSNSEHQEEGASDSTNGFGKKLAIAGIAVSVIALGYLLFSSNNETHTSGSLIPNRDSTTKIIKDTYENMDLQDQDTISDFTKQIIENSIPPENTELSIPKITDEDGTTYTSNGFIRIEESSKSTTNSNQDRTLFEKSLIEERRNAGMEIDQRLNDAKVNDIFSISKGKPAEFTDNSSNDVAPSTGRVLIIGGQVNEPDRVIDSNPIAVDSVSPDYNMYSGSTGGYAEDAINNIRSINPKEIGKNAIMGTMGIGN